MYEKRLCILKQLKKGFTADGSALSGAVYVERLGEELTVTPRLLGIAPVKDGRYALAIWIEGGVYVAELGNGASVRLNTPSIKTGLAVLLVYVRGTAEAVAFGSCGIAPSDHTILLSAFEKQEKRRVIPMPLPPTELPAPFSPTNVPLAPTVPLPEEEFPEESDVRRSHFREQATAKYDDEAIAESDYYGGDARHEDGQSEGGDQRREEAAADGAALAENDGARHPFLCGRGSLTYYTSVREKLGEVFKKYEKDDRLNAVFPCSEWVKTNSALLGILYESGMPRYLCVAVEANASDKPPAEMKEHCRFVPASPVSDTVGFFVVFQSADTGEYVTVYDE